ncbi:hypothetical protein Gotur_004183 [Gossypium turneri]
MWDFTRISVTQNNLQELKEIWDQWNDEVKQLFYSSYGDLPCLLDIKVDKHLFRAFAQFWNPAYSCFTFGGGDLVPTVEEYMALLRCSKIQADRVYSKAANVPTFLKKLVSITGMSEQWVAARIKQKGDSKCIPWKSLRDLIPAHLDTKKKVDIFALSVYGLVVFPKALGHVDEAVTDLFDRLNTGVTPVPVILVETFRSLNECRRAVAIPRQDDIPEERWMEILRNLRKEDIEWRAHWMLPDEILYRCGTFDWVPLLGIWGAFGYAPLLVLRQYRSRKNAELENKIEQMEGEKMNLRLDRDVQKLETEKLRKRKNRAEGDLDSLKTDYKRLRCSMKATGLGKTLEQWCQEIQEEKSKADR